MKISKDLVTGYVACQEMLADPNVRYANGGFIHRMDNGTLKLQQMKLVHSSVVGPEREFNASASVLLVLLARREWGKVLDL